MADWTNNLPDAAREYLVGKRLDEVECVVADLPSRMVASHPALLSHLDAIAVMGIDVDIGDPVQAIVEQGMKRQHRVVEEAEAGCPVAQAMMGAARQMAGNAMLQSELGCQHGTGGGQEGSPDQPLAPGQVHLSFFACRKLIAGEAGKIIRAMGLGQPGLPAWGRAKAVGLGEKAFRASVVGKQPELFHRKAMPGREWEAVVWMVNDGYGHGRSGCSGVAASGC